MLTGSQLLMGQLTGMNALIVCGQQILHHLFNTKE
jgi:hypothetical protein